LSLKKRRRAAVKRMGREENKCQATRREMRKRIIEKDIV
jgi:hypothetical protein